MPRFIGIILAWNVNLPSELKLKVAMGPCILIFSRDYRNYRPRLLAKMTIFDMAQ